MALPFQGIRGLLKIAMRTVQIIIITFILITIGTFIFVTMGKSPEVILFQQIQTNDQNLIVLISVISLLILVSTLSGLPVFYFGMALGFLLPIFPAILTSWLINLLSVLASFLMVRFAFFKYFSNRYAGKNFIRNINKKIGKYGIWSVIFSRAIYIIPTNIINFSFPLSRISFPNYITGTMIGLIPEVTINVTMGYLIRHEIMLISSEEARSWKFIMIAGFLFILTLIFIFLRLRQKRIRRIKGFEAVVSVEE